VPLLVPPSWNKLDYGRHLAPIWKRAAEELSNAENIFVIGYSLPETDAFFRHLYALGSLGDRLIKRFWVFDLDRSGSVESRFRAVLGKAALSRFKYSSNGFPYGFEADIRTVPP
jgi:hypothetical protein